MFKCALKDYNIALGRGFNFVKNDKYKVCANCTNENYEWEIYLDGVMRQTPFK